MDQLSHFANIRIPNTVSNFPTPTNVSEIVTLALAEDMGTGDITADLISASAQADAKIICRESGMLCGIPWAEEVFEQLDPSIDRHWLQQDGAMLSKDQSIARFRGNARSILTAERTILNFLQTLSGTASKSAYFASLVAHTNVKLLDTRKTLPGLRVAQKYAVALGGCHNHRMGLFDAFLIKENHISASGGLSQAIENARRLHPDKPVEIEVQNLQQLKQALTAEADIVMLDNFSLKATHEAVALNSGQSKLEASGGINEDSLVKIAETGVDYISIGALTKDCKALDLSLLID